MRLNGQDDGYAMAALLVALSVMAILLAVAMPTWTQVARREKEEELVWRGNQYARAIGLFQRKYANAFPPDIDTLVREKFLRKKYKDPITNDDFVPLRQGQQINTPGSGTATAAQPGQTPPTAGASGAGATPAASGGGATGAAGMTAGVSGGPGAQPLGSTASGGFGTNIGGPAALGGIIGVTSKSKDKSIRIYNGRNHYNEWAFVFTQQTMAPGAPGAPGGAPGSMGQPGMMGPGGSPMAPGTTPGATPPRPPGPSGQQPPSMP